MPLADAGRVPPSDLDAESAVLSALLLRARDCLDDVQQLLRPEHFYADANRRIYEAILELDTAGSPIDIVLVAGRLREQGKLDGVGGSPYLAQLSDATPAVAHVLEHAAVIVEKARVRQVIAACQKYGAEGYDDVGEPKTWSGNVAQVFSEIAATGNESDPPETFAELLPREMNSIRERAARKVELSGLDTKLTLLNKLTSGLMWGKCHVLGGRPGMGKTSAAVQLAINAAEQDMVVLFASAEMDKGELTRKAVAIDARVDYKKINSGVMQREDWVAVAESAKRLAALPLVLFFQPGMTIPALRAAVRKAMRAFPGKKLGLVVVDYIQLLNGRDLVPPKSNREQEVAELVKRVTWMAGEFGAPFLALSQINRSVEDRSNKNKRPNISDLRESGAIEQDAYTISLLYRDEYYNKDSREKGVIEWIVGKNRGGAKGTAFLKFTAEYGRVDNLAADYEYGGDYDTGEQQ